MYKMYEMYKRYKEYEVESIWNSTVFVKKSEANHFLAENLLLWCNSRSIWKLILAVWPLETEQRLYPNQPTIIFLLIVYNGTTYPSYNSANYLGL